jgi:hypothetical protein
MKRTAILILLLLSTASARYAEIIPLKKHKPGLFYLDFAYKHEFTGNVKYSGKGIAFDIGLNVGRLVNSNLMITPFGGLNVLWGNRYNDTFLNDFNVNYVEPDLENEEEYYYALHDAIQYAKQIQKGHTEGNVQLTYGVLVTLPFTGRLPTKIYKIHDFLGIVSESGLSPGTHVYGSTHTGILNTLDRNGWGVEVYLYSLKSVHTESWVGSMRLGYISLFYESLNFSEATIYQKDEDSMFESRDVKFMELATQDFADTYTREWKIGIRCGLNIF